MYNGSSLPSIVSSLYWFRKIYLEEGVQLVHGHSVSTDVCVLPDEVTVLLHLTRVCFILFEFFG